MKSIWPWIAFNLFLVVSSSSDDSTKAFIEITELGYEDVCHDAADAEWLFINSTSNKTALSIWEKKQIEYAEFKNAQKEDIYGNISREQITNPSLLHKYEVIEKAGDALLDIEDWKNLVHFVGTAQVLRSTATYASKTKKFAREDTERLLSHSGNAENKRLAWTGWHQELTPLLANYTRVLPLILKAAKANEAKNVEEYWEMLSGYPDGYNKIKYQWSRINGLHKKLVQFTQTILSSKYGISMNKSIPAYLLGSLQGYDWTPLAIDVTPHPKLVYDIRKNLWKKKFIGKSLYKAASNMGSVVLGQVPQSDFWDKSRFNQQCPAQLINLCKDGQMRLSTCFEATIPNFLSAHKNVGKVLFNQMSTESTPVLNIVNRYSVMEEGVSELFGILSVSPAWLESTQLLNKSVKNDERQIVSLMITALNVLPRLAYYISADMWRINAIETGITEPADLVSSWWKYRLEYEEVTSDNKSIPTFLNDDYIIANRPYLPKFLGTVVAFQLYEYLVDSTEVRYDQINLTAVDGKSTNAYLIKMIQHGAADDWAKILEKDLEIDEVSIEALLSFFSPLEEFIEEFLEEYLEDFKYQSDSGRETELEEYERKVIQEINTPTTTTTTTTPAPSTTKRIMSTTPNSDTDAETMKKKPLDSDSSIQADKPENHLKEPNDQTESNQTEVPLEKSLYDEEDEKPKINTSKAVWAVSAVLIAIVTICIIAIFGRQRCRKTPKNRRYV